ncbi:MAG: ankyrin repeat domain-containing protein [Anaerolineaceae bacterium]|nr:ankyrin repeat domain-containing protein [Anaerolineaceae bacterium]
MRTRLLLSVLFLLLLTSAAQAQEFEPAWLEVADVALRLRSGPSTDDAIITQLTPHEAVQLLQRGEQWSHIRRQDGTSGWAHNDYLLPWDKRNRPDARRRVGEKRLFNFPTKFAVAGPARNFTSRHAELRAVSDHSFIYAVKNRAHHHLPPDETLQRLGSIFDEDIYRQALDLWGAGDPPAPGGDERIVILLTSGYDREGLIGGWYPHGLGYIGLAINQPEFVVKGDFLAYHLSRTLAHEFGHMLHDHTGNRNRADWVVEGLAEFTQAYLVHGQTLEKGSRSPGPTHVSGARTRLFAGPCIDYETSKLFITYIYERLGVDLLRDFADHPRQGMAALDALLSDYGAGMSADEFHADWMIANYLNDVQRDGGRYGYPLLQGDSPMALSAPHNFIRQLPAGLDVSSDPYITDYYELPLLQDDDAPGKLLLDFRLHAPAPQDAWVQVVQVLPERVDVQRFRANDYRGRPMLASRQPQAQRAFLAITTFTPGDYRRVQPVRFSLALRALPAQPDDRAQVTARLHVRSGPDAAAASLGRLRACSWVQVLQRGPEWSQVLAEDGLSGWSHNDYLFHLNSPSAGAPAFNCASLTNAVWNGNYGTAQHLLASGAKVNDSDAFGRTALHEAAFWGHRDLITLLLRAGADIHAQDVAGRTPLDDVLHSGDSRSILQLYRAGENLDLGDPALQPLLIAAAATGNRDFLELLLNSGHDINWRDETGRSALATAAANGQERVLRTLIDAGANASLADGKGRTPFMHAAAGGNLVTLERIHRAGIDVNHVDREGHNALTLAAANGQTMNVAWLLLSTDVDVNHALPDSGRMALHLAAARGHADVIAMLLLGDADRRRRPQPVDAGARDAEGFTPLQLATAAGHARAATRLNMMETDKLKPHNRYHLGAEVHAAARSGDLAELERLIRADAWISATDAEGYTPLMRAVQAGNREVVLRLLLAGASPNERDNWQWDEPAMFFTIRSGDDDLTAMLLLAGASGRTGGNNAMEWTASFGRADVLRLLLDLKTPRRFRIDTRKMSTNQTALHHAVNFRHERVVEILLDSGADPNARTSVILDHQSALDIARRGGNRQIIDMLLAAGAEA